VDVLLVEGVGEEVPVGEVVSAPDKDDGTKTSPMILVSKVTRMRGPPEGGMRAPRPQQAVNDSVGMIVMIFTCATRHVTPTTQCATRLTFSSLIGRIIAAQ
jgi:hypothetical protein